MLQIGDRLSGPGLYRVNGLQRVVGAGVEQPLGDAGLDAHQRDVMRDHVVQLPGDADPFLQHGSAGVGLPLDGELGV